MELFEVCASNEKFSKGLVILPDVVNRERVYYNTNIDEIVLRVSKCIFSHVQTINNIEIFRNFLNSFRICYNNRKNRK